LITSGDMSIIQKAANAFVLATADDEMQDRWIPDEEWKRHIRSKEYYKPCMVISLNFGISGRFQFYNMTGMNAHLKSELHAQIGGKKYIADKTYVVGPNNQLTVVDLLSAS
jgi:hypothetical protein